MPSTLAPVAPVQTADPVPTTEQLAAVKALMAELHKKTSEATSTLKTVPPGMVSDTLKI